MYRKLNKEVTTDEITAEQVVNPLEIGEIVNTVAKYVEDKTIKPRWYSIFNWQQTNAASAFAATSRLFHAAIQGSRLAHKCAFLTSCGEEARVKQLFDISPSHIRYMIVKVDFEDFAGRKMHCSAFQYAIWVQDWHMWQMMLRALEEAATKAINNSYWDPMPEEIKRQYPHVITHEQIKKIRAELFAQYKEVVDQGLDYTMMRYPRAQDAMGAYLTFPYEVCVRGETHFDLQGPEFCLMPTSSDFIPEKGKFYVKVEDGYFYYQVIALSGEPVMGSIDLSVIGPLSPLDAIEQLKPYIPTILKITAKAGHTHPQSLISALETYIYAFDNHWDDDPLVQQWCGGVGMAQREVPAVIAQQICRTDVRFSSARDSDFKEHKFQRSLNLYNYHTFSEQSWFPVTETNFNQIGLDCGVVSCLQQAPGVVDWAGIDEARVNLEALSVLCAVRANDIALLRDKLDPDSQLAWVLGPRPCMV